MSILNYFSIELATLYFNAAIAIAAFLALGQIVVAKETAFNNSKREAVKLATDLVKFYLNDCVDNNRKSLAYKESKNIILAHLPVRLFFFNMEEVAKKVPKDIIKHSYALHKDIWDNHRELSRHMLDEMNDMEVLSSPFVSGVADSETAFKSIGISFCSSVELLWFEYAFYRSFEEDPNFFSSTISLYNNWKGKMEKRKLEATKLEVEKEIARITSQDVKPIGT
ncbi:MAG: hypothetical protein WAV50_02540 [Minisyncoccia bacterium]